MAHWLLDILADTITFRLHGKNVSPPRDSFAGRAAQ